MLRFLIWSAFGLLLSVSATPALAQTPRPERPYRGLFGSGSDAATDLLTANVSIAAGYDDNLLADALGGAGGGVGRIGSSPGVDTRGVLTHLSGSLAYTHNSDGLSLDASAGTGGRYYPSGEQRPIRSSFGRVSLARQVRSGTSFTLGALATHQPHALTTAFTDLFEPQTTDLPALDGDLAAALTSYLAYEGDLEISHRIARRTTLSGSYSYRGTDDRGGRGEFSHQRVGGLLAHQVARGLTLRAGYRYGKGRYADDRRIENHLIDAGANYNRALSISRRTTLSFGTGSSATSVRDTLRFAVIGDVNLNHEVGRSWNASVSYARRVLMHETWEEPVLGDTVTAGFGGLITRRLQFTSTARAVRGNVGLGRGAPGFTTYYANGGLAFAPTRFVKIGVTYSYYRQQMDESVVLPFESPNLFDRQSVRVNVTLWAPLFQHGRRANASR